MDSEDKPWHRNATLSSSNSLHFNPFTFFRVASLVWGKFKMRIKRKIALQVGGGGDHNVYRRRQTTLSNRVHYVHKGRTLPEGVENVLTRKEQPPRTVSRTRIKFDRSIRNWHKQSVMQLSGPDMCGSSRRSRDGSHKPPSLGVPRSLID